ncbi:PDZ domain-containing protein [Oligoflexia bacterium]|nr:PDZ domain-containing protein [Oligoflexia bacterium]
MFDVSERRCVLLLVLVASFAFSGCESLRSWRPGRPGSQGDGVQLKDLRAAPTDLLVREVTLKQSKLADSIKTGNAVDKIRLVQVFQRVSEQQDEYPAYRMFGIVPGGPYQLLGLRNGDVLIAANDWVLFEPQKFKQYVFLLQKEQAAQIEIQREGRPILFKYQFVK